MYLDTFAVGSWILNAWIVAVIICLIYYYALQPNFESYDLYTFGTSVFMGLSLALQAKVAFLHHQWAYPQALAMFLSILAMFLFVYILSAASDSDTGGFYGIATIMYEDPLFWFYSCLVVPIAVILLDVLAHLVYYFFIPTDEMMYREIDRKVLCIICPSVYMLYYL